MGGYDKLQFGLGLVVGRAFEDRARSFGFFPRFLAEKKAENASFAHELGPLTIIKRLTPGIVVA